MKVISYITKSGKVQTITVDELRKLKVDLTNQWESLCRNCGKCCFDKTITEKGVMLIDYNKPCEFLKFVGRKSQCEVYSDRFVKKECCHTIPEAIQKRALPPDCPYVQDVPGYKAPLDLGKLYKVARNKLSRYNFKHRYDDDSPVIAGTPTGGSSTFGLPAKPPVREDLAKPEDWKRRRKEQEQRKAGGSHGVVDPREKNNNLSRRTSGYMGGD